MECLEATEKPKDLQGLVEDIRDVYGVENVVYHSINSAGEEFGAFTYKYDWAAHYYSEKYVNVDPVVRGAMRQFHPMDWKRLDWSSRPARNLFHEAASAGVGNQGYTVPIRGPGGSFAMLTMNDTSSDDRWSKFVGENSRDMLLMSHYVHHRASQLLHEEEPEIQKDLSPRERDALSLLARGSSRGQVAELLKISEHTLRVYIDTARTKLGALNTTHAIVLAYKSRLIHI